MSRSVLPNGRHSPLTIADPVSTLRAAHDTASTVIGALDLDNPRVWAAAEVVIAELAGETLRTSAALTGSLARPVPPHDRVKELADAQRCLLKVLDTLPTLDSRLLSTLDGSAARIQLLAWLLRDLSHPARSRSSTAPTFPGTTAVIDNELRGKGWE